MVVFYRPESELSDKKADEKADKKADKKQYLTPHPAKIIEYLQTHEFITNCHGAVKTGHAGTALCSHHEGHEVGSQGIHV
jgi:hypothetical protein